LSCIATADISAETDLFTIPRSAIISVETSELAKKLPALFKTSNNGPTMTADPGSNENGERDENVVQIDASDLPVSWLNLILVLLYESLHHSTSQWSPYLFVLPRGPTSFNTLMFWTPSELTELQASAMPSKIGKDSADRMFKDHIITIIEQHADIFYPGTERLTHEQLLESCHVIGSLIMSYAFDLQPDEDDDDDDEHQDGWVEDQSRQSTMGMVPMADMLNADAEFNAHLSHGDDCLTMTSLREIKAGEEVLNYYGPLPNGELLRRYGYTSDKHTRYDVVEISWDLVKEVLVEHDYGDQVEYAREKRQVKLALFITKIDADEENDVHDGFVLEREAGDPTEEGLCSTNAKFTKFPEELIEVITDIVSLLLSDDLRKRKANEEGKKRLVKTTTLEILFELVSKRLGQYETTVSQDEELLSRVVSKGRLSMAIDVRLGEKRLLQEALSWTRAMQDKYKEVERENNAPVTQIQQSRKKQKTGR
jgi:N-lysine methyltransferase SETD6